MKRMLADYFLKLSALIRLIRGIRGPFPHASRQITPDRLITTPPEPPCRHSH